MGYHNRAVLVLFLAIGFALRSTDCDNILLPDQIHHQQQPLQLQQTQPQQQQQPTNNIRLPDETEGRQRQGKHLLDFVGLGTGANTDPYLARTNAACLNGELADCFKSQAIGTFSDFFNKPEYILTDNARITRIPEQQYRSLEHEPYEYSSEPRAEESEWDHLVKFALRKVEKFMKSAVIEVQMPDEITEGGRYSPRFISDDIADEIDVIEDKKAPLFRKNKLKKLFIPLLIILKLFKLKLLLFLPLILGLASFKKLLGFAAIVIPGLIGYFKLCKPQQQQQYGQYGGSNYYSNGFPQYSPQGLGAASYQHHTHYENSGPSYREEQNYAKPYGDYYGKNTADGGVRFGEAAQDLAYQGQVQYRNKDAPQ